MSFYAGYALAILVRVTGFNRRVVQRHHVKCGGTGPHTLHALQLVGEGFKHDQDLALEENLEVPGVWVRTERYSDFLNLKKFV